MIEYKFKEESDYVLYYAEKLQDSRAIELLKQKEVKDSSDALYLSKLFWRIVDASIEDEKSGIVLPWSEGAEFWNEKLMNSLSGYLERAGYESEWDRTVDEQ